jgi:hypothetical protein
MANRILSEIGDKIYAHIRENEVDPLHCLFEFSEKIFDRGLHECWVSTEDYNYYKTILDPAKEYQRDALQRLIGLISKYVLIGRRTKYLSYESYLHYSQILDKLADMIRNELEMYGKPRIK